MVTEFLVPLVKNLFIKVIFYKDILMEMEK